MAGPCAPRPFVVATVIAAIIFAPGQARAEEAPPPQPAPVAPPPAQVVVVREHTSHGLWGDADYRSPGLAAALSLTPVPVDFGNLYAENVGWGIAYTGAEIALSSGMMWLGASHMCHGGANGCGDWSNAERSTMIGLVAGYVIVKVVAGVHAASAAHRFNDEHRDPTWQATILPFRGGAVLGSIITF
jgi:hypothetical protein